MSLLIRRTITQPMFGAPAAPEVVAEWGEPVSEVRARIEAAAAQFRREEAALWQPTVPGRLREPRAHPGQWAVTV